MTFDQRECDMFIQLYDVLCPLGSSLKSVTINNWVYSEATCEGYKETVGQERNGNNCMYVVRI